MVAQTPMILLLVCALVCQGAAASAKPLDVWYLGSLDSGLHGIRGKVYAASGDTLVLRGFSYDGRAPGARFIIGRGNSPDGNGIVVKDDAGSFEALKAYRNQTLVLKLTAGNKITDFNWFSVYDRKAKRSFAHVEIPANLHLPRARTVATHMIGDHANATAIVIEDKNTLLLKNFYFDGSVPGTHFLVGKGNEPGLSKGIILHEKGSNSALGMYAGANLRLTLPKNMTVDDIDWFAVSCANCTRPLVHGAIPKHINVPVNARLIKRKSRLGLLRIRAQPANPGDFKNCETVYKDVIQVGWHLDADTITFNVRAVAALNMWTAFGLSGADDKSMMEGADVAVISVIPPNNKVTVEDYYLTEKTQCSGKDGVCPDTVQSGTNDLTVKSATFANGIVDVVYSRKLDTGDAKDKVIKAQGQTAVVAAQGPLNEAQTDTVLYHTAVVTRNYVTLEFARTTPALNCPPLPTAPQPPIPGGGSTSKLFGGHDMIGVTNFTASIGPTGGEKFGYQAITGMPGWGISWWINGELIPVLHVERGKTYTFNVQGGDNVNISAKYHPFYITDSNKGGGSKVLPPDAIGKPGNLLYAGVVIDPAVNAIDPSKDTTFVSLDLDWKVERYGKFGQGV
ncbi:protein Skeletor, isoforms B/C-like [Rhipicephalus sanguineus]|uniref:protein Skeletor, isoforms B/C-like n=1 Tax=Rhipicephalus sanguineus TaxID=34632 RepID=UPI0020C3336A|nr:protein Skeletor, isoforms B/C-like [Rhipicephalus sanguineus]